MNANLEETLTDPNTDIDKFSAHVIICCWINKNKFFLNSKVLSLLTLKMHHQSVTLGSLFSFIFFFPKKQAATFVGCTNHLLSPYFSMQGFDWLVGMLINMLLQ